MLENLATFLFYIAGPVVLVFSTGFLCILVHEAGHALPLLCFSKRPVDIYIGSVIHLNPSHRLRVGRLTIFVSHNPFHWYKGMCKPSGAYSKARQLWYVGGGPLASLVFALPAYLLLSATEGNTAGRWLMGMVLVYTLYVFLTSIVPFRLCEQYAPLKGNDGWMLLQLLKMKTAPSPFYALDPLVAAGKFTEAISLFESLMASHTRSTATDRMGLWLFTQVRDYGRAAQYSDALRATTSFTANDHFNAGYFQCMLGNQSCAVEYFEKTLLLEPKNVQALTNISYSLVLLERYQDAIGYAGKAIAVDPRCAGALDNRGLARLMTGLLEQGKEDIEAAIRIDPTRPELYRNLGIYHLLNKRYAQALALFEKAKGMDTNTPFIDDYIGRANSGFPKKDKPKKK